MTAECEANLARATRSGEGSAVQPYRGGEHTVGQREKLFTITRSTTYRADGHTANQGAQVVQP